MAEIGHGWTYRHRPRRAGRLWVAERRDRERTRAERSAFLAEFEDLHGVDSPDVLPSLAEATSGQPLIRTKSVDDAPTPSEKPSMGAVLTRALHANALALSRALRFPAPRADSLEEAARSVRREAPPSPARLEKIQPWTGHKHRLLGPRAGTRRLDSKTRRSGESVQDKLSSQDPALEGSARGRADVAPVEAWGCAYFTKAGSRMSRSLLEVRRRPNKGENSIGPRE